MPEPHRRPSLTARAVAVGRAVGLGAIRDPLVGELLDGADRAAIAVLRSARRGPLARIPAQLRPASALAAHASLRMHAVDAAVRAALATSGAEQMVVVGAGYDTRAWRLPELAGTTVIEVDLPAIQRRKRRRLTATPLADAVTFLAADLSRRGLDEVLTGADLRLDAPTVWVWEAVAPYLPADAVRTTLTAIGRRSAPGSTLIMTFAVPELLGAGPAGRLTEPLARAAFRMIGEPLLWLAEDEEVIGLLEEAGFTGARVSTPRGWAADAGVEVSPRLLAAERLVVAARRGGVA